MELILLGLLLAAGIGLATSDAKASTPTTGTPPVTTPPTTTPPPPSKTPPASGLPVRYSYPRNTIPNGPLSLFVKVDATMPADVMTFARQIAKMVTGREFDAVQLVNVNPCLWDPTRKLVVGDQVKLPEDWKEYIDQNIFPTGGVSLPAYPAGAPFETGPRPKGVCE